jgi:hypothetical protein
MISAFLEEKDQTFVDYNAVLESGKSAINGSKALV